MVAAGKPLVLECSPPKGHPEPTVTWKKDGIILNQNSSYYTVQSRNLTHVLHFRLMFFGVRVG